MYRTHTCGELRREHIGSQVTLAGWAQRVRALGGLSFIQLRDRYGSTQLVHECGTPDALSEAIAKVDREASIQIKGTVVLRKEKDMRPEDPTGEIEVTIQELTVLNGCAQLPFEIDDREKVKEETKFKYRFLDLRRPRLQHNLAVRHQVMQVVKEVFTRRGFLEMHTPLFVRSTPEGARDYVVPCRTNPGTFYALPQSPQLYKQMLMISGFDRYFQFAHCFRDEDLRADRAPVHTQIDFEMSYVEQADVHDVVEDLIVTTLSKVKNIDIPRPFQVLSYDEAMDRYGSDKPDLRIPLELKNVTEIAQHIDFGPFKEALALPNSKGRVYALRIPGAASTISRKQIDAFAEHVKRYALKGLFTAKFTGGAFDTGIAKFLTADNTAALGKALDLTDGDFVFFGADAYRRVQTGMGQLRLAVGRELGLVDTSQQRFLWVNDFPMFEWDEALQQYIPMHHIFTMPKKEYHETLEQDPESVKGYLYDLVWNGVELL